MNNELKQAARQALEWFDIISSVDRHKWPDWGPVEDALRSALSHPETEAVQVPQGATHYQPHQKTYYKRISAIEWKLWSERNGWVPSPGTSDSAEWVTLNGIAALEASQPMSDGAPQAGEAEPLFLLYTGQIDGGGEQDEWDTEANSWNAVEEFCRKHPGQTVGLYPASQPMSREGTVKLFGEAIAWGMVYGPEIPSSQWDGMRDGPKPMYSLRYKEMRDERDSLRAEIESMKVAINGLIEVINRSNTSSGVCCCGDSMETHNDWCAGHSGVDDGDYNALTMVNYAKTLLSEEKGKK